MLVCISHAEAQGVDVDGAIAVNDITDVTRQKTVVDATPALPTCSINPAGDL